MSYFQSLLKRVFDISLAIIGLILTGWLILFSFIFASIDTNRNGFFSQLRVGRHGKLFRLYKLRTMRDCPHFNTTVTTSADKRITKLGGFLRKTKIDELPQLVNVLLGHMSFVGPRPDVPGFADKLEGEDRVILSVRPGITGPATLKFKNEEKLLACQDDPEKYNAEVLYPEKVRLNKEYIQNYSFWTDIKYILMTIVSR